MAFAADCMRGNSRQRIPLQAAEMQTFSLLPNNSSAMQERMMVQVCARSHLVGGREGGGGGGVGGLLFIGLTNIGPGTSALLICAMNTVTSSARARAAHHALSLLEGLLQPVPPDCNPVCIRWLPVPVGRSAKCPSQGPLKGHTLLS